MGPGNARGRGREPRPFLDEEQGPAGLADMLARDDKLLVKAGNLLVEFAARHYPNLPVM